MSSVQKWRMFKACKFIVILGVTIGLAVALASTSATAQIPTAGFSTDNASGVAPDRSNLWLDTTTYAQGRERGLRAARKRGEWSFAFRGLLGGGLAGPLGAAITYFSIDEAVDFSPVQHDLLDGRDSLFVAGYSAGFRSRLLERQKERVLLGGIAGTGLFIAALIHFLDLSGQIQGTGPMPPARH